MKNKEACRQLLTHHTLPVRTFGLPKSKMGSNDWLFRRLITNILVGGTLEENALSAGEAVFSKYPTIEKLSKANANTLTNLLNKHSIRFAERKANYVKCTTEAIYIDHDGIVPDDRKALEKLHGVGRHVASIVLALGFEIPAFAVDLHVKRIALRLGLIEKGDGDITIEQKLTRDVLPQHYGRYSRAFVDLGKTICAKEPNCSACYLQKQCKQKTSGKVVVTATSVEVEDGVYKIVAGSSSTPYTVRVNAGRASCNCKGYRFRRTCSHVKEVQGA